MRIGAALSGTELVAAAEAAGMFGINVRAAGVEASRASEVAVTTTDARVLVRVVLGDENPVTLAEEVAVLDHLSAGRVVAIVDTGDLDVAGAAEDLALLRKSWSGRIFRHEGARWTVPSGVITSGVPTTVSVTPKPAQIDIPVWLDGPVARSIAIGVPVIARSFDEVDPAAQVQPAIGQLSGDLTDDRELVIGWSDAGATHLLVEPPAGADADFFAGYVARYLQPEVSMPSFPRVMAEADLPSRWTP
ncbi:LLM class flavin-dependent oxidoreductase [Nakamurella sp. YIM 132087]|uniref:LLM class flavin-dependent oxidoreductase n=1 Tax=Nakamurella alba TaxID=2665158 RepID=A0A7K1FM24_9ACTN|nr:LLM class flavin-dependent oxidoreductase [Nakamurella alba]MTD15110.1 LLM class flavin-dependent oxidoreductase [Nakamurella alba]